MRAFTLAVCNLIIYKNQLFQRVYYRDMTTFI